LALEGPVEGSFECSSGGVQFAGIDYAGRPVRASRDLASGRIELPPGSPDAIPVRELNMKRMLFGVLALGLSGVATSAAAQDEGGVSIAITGGTLGIGPEVGYRMSENFGVRGSATFFGLNREVDSDGIAYEGDLKLKS
jgi:hypothetical protein